MRHGPLNPFNPGDHHRRSIRLPGYDYAEPGSYFVTLVTQHRFCAFGAVVDGVMHANVVGEMVETVWNEIPDHYPGVGVDAFVVMPNHVHGIVVLRDETADAVGATPRGCPGAGPDDGSHRGDGVGQARGPAPTTRLSLPDVVHRFKSLTTSRYIAGVKQYAWPEFPGHFWQRNYHEHIIRNDPELARIRRYIEDNPARWESDRNFVRPGIAPRRPARQRLDRNPPA